MERPTTQEVDTVEEEDAVVVVDRGMEKSTEEETKGMEEPLLLLQLSETVLSSHRWATKDTLSDPSKHLPILSPLSFSLILLS